MNFLVWPLRKPQAHRMVTEPGTRPWHWPVGLSMGPWRMWTGTGSRWISTITHWAL